jgi:hypothetical protein
MMPKEKPQTATKQRGKNFEMASAKISDHFKALEMSEKGCNGLFWNLYLGYNPSVEPSVAFDRFRMLMETSGCKHDDTFKEVRDEMLQQVLVSTQAGFHQRLLDLEPTSKDERVISYVLQYYADVCPEALFGNLPFSWKAYYHTVTRYDRVASAFGAIGAYRYGPRFAEWISKRTGGATATTTKPSPTNAPNTKKNTTPSEPNIQEVKPIISDATNNSKANTADSANRQ